MNPCLILTRNCLELTKKCLESVRGQDVPVDLLVVDNYSTDGTVSWLKSKGVAVDEANSNLGVSVGWNWGLERFFDGGDDHVLVLNNDTIIPPWFYRFLLTCDAPFVTGASVESMDAIATLPAAPQLTDGPDFSAFLIRRAAWEKVGPFNERMVHYAADCDWAVRAHRAGIRLLNSHVPFYHERSSTLKLATPEDRREIELQADEDRDVFKSIYGCYPWEPGYVDLFK